MNVYLAGAPSSGKSSVLQLLQRARISRSVFCVEECFSSVVGRLPEPYRQRLCADDEETSIFRQLVISGTQAYINAVLFDTPYKYGRVVVQDRGIYDLDVYLEEKQAQVVRDTFMTPRILEISKPDLVIFFLLPEHPYDENPGAFVRRLENTFVEMKELEKRALAVWRKSVSPERFVVLDATYRSVAFKARHVAKVINSCLEYACFDPEKIPV